jgi:CelD/BcsL family acetyltransferase involved in cellulose biosynthesis
MKTLSDEATAKVLTEYDHWASLRQPWNDLVAKQSGEILQLDVTCTFEWAMTLWRNHLGSQEQQVLVLKSGAEINGILPLYRFRKQVHGLPCRVIAPWTEHYSGRCGFLLREPSCEQFGVAMEALIATTKDWDVFQFALIDGSAQDQEFVAWQKQSGFICEEIGKQTSPYITLQQDWQQQFASLPKKFRSTIRNGEKRMRERGRLEYREIRSVADISDFCAVMLEIERDSWKEAAGTSLTTNQLQERFHTDLLRSAAENGWLSAHLLLLNGEPVAYVYGLFYNGIFSDLKESYKDRYREMSPSHVLKAFVFESLYAHNARLYDFMGVCEEYKMKWTDQTYTRTSYLLYNSTARAWAAQRVGRLKANSQLTPASAKG